MMENKQWIKKDVVRYFEIWIADLPLVANSHVQGGRRPVLVVSNDKSNMGSPVVSIIPMTSKMKRMDLPTHIVLQGDGLRCAGIALCEQLQLIDKNRLIYRIGSVCAEKDRFAVKSAMAAQLGLEWRNNMYRRAA